MLNDYECPLVSLTKNISTVDCNQVKCAVSLVHDCTDACKFEEKVSSRRIEQKLTNEKLHFKHDWSNMSQTCIVCDAYCIVRNVFCFNFVIYSD